jgi:hypothetical protein
MVDTFTPPLFELSNSSLSYISYLEEEGYVVIKDILDQPTIDKALELFWKDWLHVTPNFNIKDPTTYPLIFGKGIASFNGFGQSDFCWYLRLQQNIINIFASIHKTNDLKVSLDGFSVFLNKQQQSKLWWHIDQHPLNPIYCIQGSYNFYDVKEGDAGFVLIPKSHKTFKTPYMEDDDLTKDWYKLKEDEDDNFIKNNKGVKILIPANCFVLWNSRLIHSNVGMMNHNSIRDLNRLTVFITYLPKSVCNNFKIKEERIEAYKKGYTTTHWVNKVERHKYPRRFEDKYIKRGFKDIEPRLDENGLIPTERFNII